MIRNAESAFRKAVHNILGKYSGMVKGNNTLMSKGIIQHLYTISFSPLNSLVRTNTMRVMIDLHSLILPVLRSGTCASPAARIQNILCDDKCLTTTEHCVYCRLMEQNGLFGPVDQMTEKEGWCADRMNLLLLVLRLV